MPEVLDGLRRVDRRRRGKKVFTIIVSVALALAAGRITAAVCWGAGASSDLGALVGLLVTFLVLFVFYRATRSKR